MAKLVDVSGLGSDEFIRRGSSPFIRIECVAQRVEQLAFNLEVAGSNPAALNYQNMRDRVIG